MFDRKTYAREYRENNRERMNKYKEKIYIKRKRKRINEYYQYFINSTLESKYMREDKVFTDHDLEYIESTKVRK